MNDECLAKACTWIDEHLELFHERSTRDLRWPPSLKSIAELGHAAVIIGARGDLARAQRWLERGWHALRLGDAVTDLLEVSAAAVTLLAPFRMAGFVSEELTTRTVARARAARCTPEEQFYVAAALGERRAGLLVSRPAPWSLDLRATYQLTHEVFYRTRWATDPDGLDDHETCWLRAWLPVWIQNEVERDDRDVVAELLIAAHAAGTCGDALAWEVLRRGQRDNGAVVRPANRRTDFGATGNHDFDEHHHSTLVAIMAWAACRH